ncbi:stealth family protein [Paractinoplanes atraurantiacus]|uniref:Stealth protein CR1, conserved region 1 n=1 Tax=Paractinoplanes atraurantiacus TaxID=1036182 RepID=A0A285FVH0_9ACTN|nr:stealth family protein [Actinoplanes atraurantiacus]SNY14306.1 Stealth protein CR1, conserved region 1 [Actinoplanes atraurantiacus]
MPLRRILGLAPWPVRRRVMRQMELRLLPHLPADRRLRAARRVVPLGPRRRLLPPAAEAPALRVRTAAARLEARRSLWSDPASVRRENLDRVVASLATAGIDWFRVPTESLTRTAVAVPESDRARVLAALEALTSAEVGRLEIAGRRDTTRLLRVCWPVTDHGGHLVYGTEYACDVELWRAADGRLSAPRPNPVADSIPAGEPATLAPEPVFGSFGVPGPLPRYRTREVFTMVSPDRVAFPVDAVYTWVDGADPAWFERKARALRDNGWVAASNGQTANRSRFASRDELRYSLRSLHAFAPWIRHVFLVTDDQVPAWLDLDRADLTVASHREIFGDTGRLPTFNSQAIESRLHRIPGLAEHFLYLNDDVFLGRPVPPEMFFTPGGLTRFFPSGARVDSSPRRPGDTPANSAGKNNRDLIRDTFGRVLTRKMKHTPHPSRRSVLAEIELRFADEVRATSEHQFRHPDDIALLSGLQQYYAYLTGRAAPGEIEYMYTDLADPSTPFRLARLLHNRNLDAFCLNDTDSPAALAGEQAALLAEFLPAYLPFPSRWELSTPRAGTMSASSTRRPVIARQATRHRLAERPLS